MRRQTEQASPRGRLSLPAQLLFPKVNAAFRKPSRRGRHSAHAAIGPHRPDRFSSTYFSARSKDSNMQTRLKLHLVKVSLFTLGAMVSTSAVLAQAGDAKAIEARQANFKEIDKHWKPVTEMLKRKIPYDAAQVQQAATAIEPLAKKIPEMFVPDTRQVTGVK